MKAKLNFLSISAGVAFLSTALFSCENFLERKPLTATVLDIGSGSAALSGKVLGLYGEVRNSKAEPYCGDGFQNIPWVAMNGFRSDDAEIVADPGASAWHQTYDNFVYAKDDWGAGLYWDKHYTFIGLCNDALDVASSVDVANRDEDYNILVAEAKFFRAFAYFDLVRTYGDVPLIDFKINTPTDGQIEKSDASEIYDLIETDLNDAIAALPISWSSGYAGRLTKGAAQTFLAKVSLYQQNWATALSNCESVINSNMYSLVEDYYKIFKTSGELGSESIFEIQSTKTAGDGDIYWSRLGQCQGIRGSGTWDLGWGWNTPTQSLVDAYEPGDERMAATILVSDESDGGESTGGYGLTLPALTNATYWNKKVYNKYVDYQNAGLGTPNNEAQNTWVNQRVFRYADVLLMAAEAANEIGGAANQVKAEDWVNEIRSRAGLDEISFVSQAQMRSAIKQERRIEFAMEYERFFDLVRWGDAASVLGSLGYEDKHKHFPIPSGALTNNPNLTQNPDWD